jgi:hypothetical protein
MMYGSDRNMPRGFGFGWRTGSRQGFGAGFAFRGSSPPWPYFGRGRGGLPRCAYPGFARITVANERDILQGQAEMMKNQLDDIERRLSELENKD